MGADVAVLDRNPEALRRVDAVLGNRVRTLFSTRDVVELLCPRADLIIATVLVPGSTTPKLITAQTVKAVKTGAMASFGTIEGPIHGCPLSRGEAIGGQPARLIGNAAVCRGQDLKITENQVDKALARRQLARVLGEKKELGLDERLM
jgi:hypothetical protein